MRHWLCTSRHSRDFTFYYVTFCVLLIAGASGSEFRFDPWSSSNFLGVRLPFDALPGIHLPLTQFWVSNRFVMTRFLWLCSSEVAIFRGRSAQWQGFGVSHHAHLFFFMVLRRWIVRYIDKDPCVYFRLSACLARWYVWSSGVLHDLLFAPNANFVSMKRQLVCCRHFILLLY